MKLRKGKNPEEQPDTAIETVDAASADEASSEVTTATGDALEAPADEETVLDTTKSAPDDRATEGPLDESEANAVRPYIDLGGVKILPREGLNLRLEIEESTKRIVAVGLDYAESTLQIQAFAAPRSIGLWNETREQIAEQIGSQGGTVTEREGGLGYELLAEVPVQVPAGQPAATRIARFVGVDGPRWFLRGVIAGAGATDAEKGALVEELFRSVVVVRGDTPMPPRDLIPLKMPAGAGQEA
ncbi:DUF3710 domain-containing protein [Leifsonia sp. ALI-44-B]|jgi:hypothetical protein|uniref:DUF3710 domain-containing protein n=1 Tax=Leifsonia sp. ALI-44-B TaxID=1933776 RepID=UPI0009FAD951|nr:DUF3710 domain-containing protein [Leifsonia sp. ALI-44-B]